MPTYDNILITGGAGFIGSNFATRLRTLFPKSRVTALDNLKRRGSEMNLPRLRDHDVRFVHGDIRCPEDLAGFTDPFDLVIECSAEPSVLAGFGDNPAYVIQTNLSGTINCLELARRHGSDFVFLSTSRVYPVASLKDLAYDLTETRFVLRDEQPVPGVSSRGIRESFPLSGSRTLYGATKLASELLIEEYHATYGLRTLINRCGVVAGPWQMGKVDQGVFSLWLLAHYFDRPLKYIGYGGSGKQVRDLLHVDDLFDALRIQLSDLDRLQGRTFNVGGGTDCSLSLLETTALCEEITGRSIPIEQETTERNGDIPVYISDCTTLTEATGWIPTSTPRDVLGDIFEWVQCHERDLQAVFTS
jgi:CDP-paratose 2-epimerase